MASIDEEVKTKFANDRHRCIANLIFTSNWINTVFTDFLRPFDLSSQQFNILRILKGAKDWRTMNEIKSLMIEKAPNATRLSDKLLDKGLIDRKRCDEDRRVVYLHITQKGLDLLVKIDEAEKGAKMQFMDRFTDEEAKHMNNVLEKIRS